MLMNERRTLNAWVPTPEEVAGAGCGKTIVLACAEGETIEAVDAKLGFHRTRPRSRTAGSCGIGCRGLTTGRGAVGQKALSMSSLV